MSHYIFILRRGLILYVWKLEPPCNLLVLNFCELLLILLWVCFVSDFLLVEREMSKDDFVYMFELDFHAEMLLHSSNLHTSRQWWSCFARFLSILGSLLEGFICPFMVRLGKLVHFPFLSFLFLVALMHWAWLHKGCLSMIVLWFLVLHVIPCFFNSHRIMTKYNYSLIINYNDLITVHTNMAKS